MDNHHSAQNLAYLGDAVFELMVRQRILSYGNRPVNALNKLAKRYVSAKAQAEFYYLIEPQLSEEELGVMRRGRNVNPKTKAKNASVTEYRHATGFETLMGYLYLKGNTARIEEIFEKCIGDTNEK